MAKRNRNLTFTDETWTLMQDEAEKMGVSVSSLISITMTQYIKGQKAIVEMGELRRMIEEGKFTPDEKKDS